MYFIYPVFSGPFPCFWYVNNVNHPLFIVSLWLSHVLTLLVFILCGTNLFGCLTYLYWVYPICIFTCFFFLYFFCYTITIKNYRTSYFYFLEVLIGLLRHPNQSVLYLWSRSCIDLCCSCCCWCVIFVFLWVNICFFHVLLNFLVFILLVLDNVVTKQFWARFKLLFHLLWGKGMNTSPVVCILILVLP